MNVVGGCFIAARSTSLGILQREHLISSRKSRHLSPGRWLAMDRSVHLACTGTNDDDAGSSANTRSPGLTGT
jgi:hypothetical protein